MKRIILGVVLVVIVVYCIFSALVRPSLTREWTNDQQLLATTVFNDDGTVTIKNIRNIDYQSTSLYTTAYYDASFDPRTIKRTWFLVEPFGSMSAAHTLLSFEFEDGRYLSISAEIRKEKGESFGPFKGMFRRYELVYVVADERDVIRLRTNYRKDETYLYPIKGEKEKVEKLFIEMLTRANKLATEPEMYNTLTNNCTTNIASHVRDVSSGRVPWWDFRYLFPETIDVLAHEKGLIDTTLSLEEARSYYYITKKAQAVDQDPLFSKKIREMVK